MVWCGWYLDSKIAPFGVGAIQASLHDEQGGVEDRHHPDEARVLITVGWSMSRARAGRVGKGEGEVEGKVE